MKFKHLFQVLTLIALAFSLLGASQPVQAKTMAAEPVIISYDMTVWNATYPGMVNDMRYEKWSFTLAEETSIVVNAAATSGDLVPLITLQDLNGNEISTLVGSLNATQPAGKYYLLIHPQSGSGNYNLTLRAQEQTFSASVTVDAPSVNIDDSVLVRVKFNNTPAEGFTSAEFTCSYDPAVLDVSGISDAGLFGADAVMVVNGPANGSFIVALAGSNGKKATTSGDAFVFYASGLQAGTSTITCSTRVSTGGNLSAAESSSASLNVAASAGNILGKVNASKPVEICVSSETYAETCFDANEEGIFNIPLEAGAYKVVARAEGFLNAENAAVTVAAGQETLMPQISLLAGDIDGNGVVDQFDAMTIGMSYNTATPAAADLNNDANINVLDLELLAGNYRATAPTAWQ